MYVWLCAATSEWEVVLNYLERAFKYHITPFWPCVDTPPPSPISINYHFLVNPPPPTPSVITLYHYSSVVFQHASMCFFFVFFFVFFGINFECFE